MTAATTAFVLSGGGAKGSFSAGALAHLIQVKGLAPSILTGTSAGAICAAVLAQARGHDELYAAADTLLDDIVRMSVPGAAFRPRDWLDGLAGTALGDDLGRLITGKSRPMIPADPTAPTATDPLSGTATPGFTLSRGWDDLRSLVGKLATTRKAMKGFTDNDQSVLLLDPLGAALRGDTPGIGPAPIDVARVARQGVQLRLTVTALVAGCTRYVTETGAMVEVDAVTPAPGSPSPGVVEGVLASASVPLVFPPRAIGDDVYVDGGVLANIPLEPAVALGGTDIYAVLADPLACPAPAAGADYATADMFNVLFRAEATVAFYEQQRRSLLVPRPPESTLTVIDPTVAVVSTFETSPGLLRINMDYGWLRACSVTADVDTADSQRAHLLADRITIGRLRSWYLEEGVGGSGDAATTSLASAKALVATSLESWTDLGLALPDHAGSWATAPELHPPTS